MSKTSKNPEKLVNFVRMKKSLNYLPEHKQRDLQQLVELVRNEVKDVVIAHEIGLYPVFDPLVVIDVGPACVTAV